MCIYVHVYKNVQKGTRKGIRCLSLSSKEEVIFSAPGFPLPRHAFMKAKMKREEGEEVKHTLTFAHTLRKNITV